MAGTFMWNIVLGLIGFIATFLMSNSTNPIETSLIRGCYSGAILFAIAFVLRLFVGLTLITNAKKQAEHETVTPTAGLNFDESVNDELSYDDIANDNLTPTGEIEKPSFEPFSPTKLARAVDSKELADAVRTLSDS